MDAPGPPDRADETRSTETSLPLPIPNERTTNMLEEKLAHPVKRMWNSDADESVEASKRARLSDTVENRLNKNSSNEKLPHSNVNPPSVLNQDVDTNGDENGDHLSSCDASNGSLGNDSPLLNNTEEDSSVKDSNAETRKDVSTHGETSVLNNEEESMDVEANTVEDSTLTEKSSGEDGKDRTITKTEEAKASEVKASDETVQNEIANTTDSKEKTTTGTKEDSHGPACVSQNEDKSLASEKEMSLSERNSEANQCKETSPRTAGDSKASGRPKGELENGNADAKSVSPNSNVANLKDIIEERFKEQLQNNSADNKKTNKEEDCSNAKDSKSKTNEDMSRSSSPQDDVIILSDDEMEENADADEVSSIDTGPFSPPPDDDPLSKLSEEELDQRDKVIRELQEELRTEEGKLLLLKKLRQSQQQPVQVVPKEANANASTTVSATAATTQKPTTTQSVTTALPLLLRTTQGSKIQSSTQQQQHQHQLQQFKQLQQLQHQQHQQHQSGGRIVQMPQLVRGSQIQSMQGGRNVLTTQSGPPPLVMVSRGGIQQMQNTRHIIRVSNTGTVSTTSGQGAVTHISANHQSRPSATSANDSQSAASRQAAAKLALRKQLEKTLLQIPPPKPPPPELHFLPSAANNEFIVLVGLEEVVNTILEVEKDPKRKTPQRFTDPFRCAQCKTDFTTIWKQDAKQGIMCETCIVSNQKKSLKAEHTNRLKTAFVKALQQEQEIEQRMQQSQNPVIHSQTARQLQQISQIQSSHQNRHRVMNPVPHQQRTVLNPAPSSQRVVQPVTYTYIPSMVKNSNQTFTYRVPSTQIQMVTKPQIVTSHHSAAARQREYLLDMIPSKVLNQNTPVTWKR